MSDTKELIERLRGGESNFYAESSLWFDRQRAEDVDEAADVLEAQAATIARLEAELENTRAEAALGMLAARREAMEEAARLLDAEHERRKHLDNHAKVHANMIRELMETP